MAAIDQQALAESRLILQYKDAENLKAILSAFVRQIQDLETAMQEFPAKRALLTATGVQLDGWGKILDAARPSTDDSIYRIYLYSKIAEYFSEGRIEDVIGIFKVLMGAASIELAENPPANITLLAIDPVPLGDIDLISESIRNAKAAGIGIGYLAAALSTAFAFLESNGLTSGFANIYPGQAAVTTQKQRIYFDPYPPDAGSWTLSWGGNVGTPALSNSSIASDVQTHLRSITGLSSVTVTGSFAAGYFEVTMTGVAGTSPALIVIASNTMTRTGSAVSGIVVESQKICSGTLDTGGVFASAYGVESAPISPLTLLPTAGFATHRLAGCASSFVMRVRRVVAADTVDIYDFNRSTKEYKLTATGAWIDGTSETFYCVTLYDQTGNGRDLKQTTTSKQPRVQLNYRNGYPALEYDMWDDEMRTDQAMSTMAGLTAKTLFATGSFYGTTISMNPNELDMIIGESSGKCVITHGIPLMVPPNPDCIWFDHTSGVEEYARATPLENVFLDMALVHGSGLLAGYLNAVKQNEVSAGATATLSGKLAVGKCDLSMNSVGGRFTHYYIFNRALSDADHQILSYYTSQF